MIYFTTTHAYTYRWINTLSLPTFLTAIRDALNARLAKSQHLFGKTYATEIRLAELRTSVPGAIIKISNCSIQSIDSWTLTGEEIRMNGEY